ncbi:MAG: glycosyltransferase family 4 protein [Actinomycetales bacterium]|nr:glycosyltransferase family 4 protein [Actinomycetales bacterium]MCP4893342.1 glycosyltransferase family 4 protein [Actinomycetales bacterium]
MNDRRTAQIPSPRVAALVLNSVNHDARVLKEADSLAEEGFDVHIIGIQDNRCNDPVTRRSDNVTVHRVDLGPRLLLQRYRIRARVLLLGVGMMVILAVVSLFTPLRVLLNRIEEPLLSFGLLPSLIAGGSLLAAASLLVRQRRASRSSKIKQREIFGAVASRRVASVGIGSLLIKSRSMVSSLLSTWHQSRKQRVVSRVYRQELDRLKPQAVHCHDLPMLPVGAKWCETNASAFLVFDSHELYEEVSQMHPLKRRIWQRVLRRESPKVDAFITVNDSIAGEHARRYPSLPPAVVVKNATIFDGEPLAPSRLLRAAADLEDDRRILLYQGGFARHRGLEGLVRAAAQMPEPWVLVMMGWGNIEDDLKVIAQNVDPNGHRIRFIPPAPQAELQSWTSGGDLGVIPYENTCLNHWYCSPNKLWEYPVAGVPMLVSPFPELKTVVDTHGIGICIPEELDGTALSQILSGIDGQRLETMQKACRTYIEHDNWAVYARRLVDLYASLFNPRRQEA